MSDVVTASAEETRSPIPACRRGATCGGTTWRAVLRFSMLLLLSAVFVVAGLSKAWDPAAFAREIARYRLVGPPLTGLLAVGLPWLELAVAVAIWPAWTRRAAWWIAVVLLSVFTLALVVAALRGLDVECGCFGRFWDASAPIAIVRNFALLAALIGVSRLTKTGVDRKP